MQLKCCICGNVLLDLLHRLTDKSTMATKTSILNLAIICETHKEWQLLMHSYHTLGIRLDGNGTSPTNLLYRAKMAACIYINPVSETIVVHRINRSETGGYNRKLKNYSDFIEDIELQRELISTTAEYNETASEMDLDLTVTENSNGISVSNTHTAVRTNNVNDTSSSKRNCFHVLINNYKDWEFFRYLSTRFGFSYQCGSDSSYCGTSVVFVYHNEGRDMSIVNRSIPTIEAKRDVVNIDGLLRARESVIGKLKVFNRLSIPEIEELIGMYDLLKRYDSSEASLKDVLNTGLSARVIIDILDNKVHFSATREADPNVVRLNQLKEAAGISADLYGFIPSTVGDIPGLLSDSVKTVSDINKARNDREIREAELEAIVRADDGLAAHYLRYYRDPALSGNIVQNSALVRNLRNNGMIMPMDPPEFNGLSSGIYGNYSPEEYNYLYPLTPGQAFLTDEADEFKLKTKTKSKPSIMHIEDEEVKVVRIKRPVKRKIINIKH